MARRRKRKPNLKIMIIIGLLVFTPMLQRNKVVHLGYLIYEAEGRHRNLLAENKLLLSEVMRLQNAPAIRRRMKEADIPLVEPSQWNVYYLDGDE